MTSSEVNDLTAALAVSLHNAKKNKKQKNNQYIMQLVEVDKCVAVVCADSW